MTNITYTRTGDKLTAVNPYFDKSLTPLTSLEKAGQSVRFVSEHPTLTIPASDLANWPDETTVIEEKDFVVTAITGFALWLPSIRKNHQPDIPTTEGSDVKQGESVEENLTDIALAYMQDGDMYGYKQEVYVNGFYQGVAHERAQFNEAVKPLVEALEGLLKYPIYEEDWITAKQALEQFKERK